MNKDLEMVLGKDKGRRVEVRCTYCRKFLRDFYQHEADKYSDDGRHISHGICLSCLLEHYPNEYPAIRKTLSNKTIGNPPPVDGKPENLEIPSMMDS